MPTLDWIGKNAVLNHHREVPYHLLRCDRERSVGDPGSGNLLVQGDNLEALKALLPFYAGQVKCIYIDPPYNTRSAFEHYDDNLEHTKWLAMMWPRLELLRDLLAEHGSIWISIDQNEIHYLGTICDEIFGRKHRINLLTFKQSSVSGPKSINPGIVTISSYLLVYAKEKKRWFNKRAYRKRDRDPRYTQFIVNRDDPPERWRFMTVSAAIDKHYGAPLRELRREWGARTEDRLHTFVLENRDRVVQHVRVLEQDVGETSKVALKASIEHADRVHPANREDGSLYTL